METESIFIKIDSNIKDRARVFITERKLLKNDKIHSMKSLVEVALHEYMISHP